jgi:hypothetical protein
MDASRSVGSRRIRRSRRIVASFAVVMTAGALVSSAAGASSRTATIIATTSSTSGAVLVALGVGVLVLGGVGFVLFTWTRRKRRPDQCAEQREALALAERAVQYWDAARAHLEAVERQRTQGDVVDGPSHKTLMTNAVEGLNSAIKQRDQCQLDLIHCMANGVPAIRAVPTSGSQPFFTPGTDGTPPSPPAV